MSEDITNQRRQWSLQMESACASYIKPLLAALDAILDRRLVMTLLRLVLGILRHRHRGNGLLLSELSGHICGEERSSAGLKRIGRLLDSKKWHARLIEKYLLNEATQYVKEQDAVLAIWDESQIEKPESQSLEDLCAVRSGKSARLKRIKPGYYNPPGGRPVFVPGWHWLNIMVAGMQGQAHLALMRWWSTRGDHPTARREVQAKLLNLTARLWRRRVLHVFDRGFAGAPWLTQVLQRSIRFVLRWPKRYVLRDPARPDLGDLSAAQLAKPHRSIDFRMMRDARRRQACKVGIAFFQVLHPQFQQPLTLVVVRSKNRQPWYLLTNEPGCSLDDAWRIVVAYARRWQIEVSFRFLKHELSVESPRVYSTDHRLKLWSIVLLVYACLIHILRIFSTDLLDAFLNTWATPVKKKRGSRSAAPLYRLRLAISRLFYASPPPLISG